MVKNIAVMVVYPYSWEKIIALIKESLYIDDDSHHESLLQLYQTQQFGTAIDDSTKHHLGIDGKAGGQCIRVPGHTIPLLRDG